jgi:hypothetical protein
LIQWDVATWVEISRPLEARNVRFGSKVDIAKCDRHVRFVPRADIDRLSSNRNRMKICPFGRSSNVYRSD